MQFPAATIPASRSLHSWDKIRLSLKRTQYIANWTIIFVDFVSSLRCSHSPDIPFSKFLWLRHLHQRQDEIFWLVQSGDDLILRYCHSSRIFNPSLHFNKSKPPCARNTRFNVIATLFLTEVRQESPSARFRGTRVSAREARREAELHRQLARVRRREDRGNTAIPAPTLALHRNPAHELQDPLGSVNIFVT